MEVVLAGEEADLTTVSNRFDELTKTLEVCTPPKDSPLNACGRSAIDAGRVVEQVLEAIDTSDREIREARLAMAEFYLDLHAQEYDDCISGSF
jgi:hypothetical protein